VDPTHVLIAPKRAGNPIDGPEDLLGFPLPVLEEILEVPGGLVHVENQGERHIGHLWGSPGGYRSWVTISLTRRENSVPRSVQIPAPQ
jgi:hypothetical protein